MKIIQSYIQTKSYKNLNFYAFLLNCLILKKYYKSITMYCNKVAYDSFIKYIPYDEIIIMENKYEDSQLYKIQVIEDVNDDFIYINPELIFFDNYLKCYIDSSHNFDLLVQYINPVEHFGPQQFVKKNKNFLINEKICNPIVYDNRYFSTNIVGMNKEFKEKYISNFKKIKKAIDEKNIVGDYNYLKYYNLILDELTIYLTYLNEKYKLRCYEVISYNDIIELGINNCAEKYKFTYLNDVNSKIVKLVKNKIQNEFPDDNNISNFENNYDDNKDKFYFKYKLSFCVSCMNRTKFLKKTLLHNLNLIYSLIEKYNIELVLINYDSKDDMDEYLQLDIFKKFIDEKILIYKKVYDKDIFYRSHAKNIAHLNATGDILCNSDVDCYLSEDLIEETYNSFIKYGLNNIALHSWTNYNFGYICMSKYNFNLIDGYDENLIYYAAEDYDILIRFCLKTKNKLLKLENNYNNLVINHDDSIRNMNEYNTHMTNFINSIKVYHNMINNNTNPNNGIFGNNDNFNKNKDLFNYDFFNKYVLNDEYITTLWNDIKSINKDNWLNHILMKKFNNFLENNYLNYKKIEVTTMIGCKNMCTYCPQDVFLKNYKDNFKYLTLDKWKKILKNIDKDVEIQFSGFAENFMNSNFSDILIYTYENGYKITLFTTLEGYNDDINLKLKDKVEIYNLYFHEFDSKNFNKKRFYDNVNLFISSIKVVNYHGVLKIEKEEEFSRANNNIRKKIEHKKGKIICNFGKNFLWQQNNLLLNGDVYICCQDWGLKHKIGNLNNDNLYSNKINLERQKLENLQLMDDSDIICRNCEFSKNIE